LIVRDGTLENLASGSIRGAGTIALGGGTLQSAGTLDPGNFGTGSAFNDSRVLRIGGNLAAMGTLRVGLGGYLFPTYPATDLLEVEGSLALGGALVIDAIEGYLPTAGDSATTAGSVTGTFASTAPVSGEPGTFYEVGYAATAVRVAVRDSATPALVQRFDGEAVDGGIELRWQLAADASALVLERADAAVGPWGTCAAELWNDAGAVTARDRDVIGGRTYYYRLADPRAGAAWTSPVLAIRARAEALAFGLAAPAPNPMSSSCAISWTTPVPCRARVSVLDVAGREVAVLADAPADAGRHSLTWRRDGGGARLPGGLYFVRLQVGDRAWVRRVVLR
jgi:hypothetical protein